MRGHWAPAEILLRKRRPSGNSGDRLRDVFTKKRRPGSRGGHPARVPRADMTERTELVRVIKALLDVRKLNAVVPSALGLLALASFKLSGGEGGLGVSPRAAASSTLAVSGREPYTAAGGRLPRRA